MSKKKKDMGFDLSNEKILKTEYSDEMRKSFLDYSMSVIMARAIPDVRDGFKPVHRRILYTMYENGLSSDKEYRKCADTVGSVLGKYHPHGDSSVYDALVVMAQEWKKGTTLIDGHGNFGSIEGDPSAAYRYTESKLTKFTEKSFLTDLNKDTVDFVPNFDGRKVEPSVLPARVPNVLINGTEGIAVGMTTSTPPHNLKEILEGYKQYIDNPKIKTEELMKIVIGPDFPTGGVVINKSELLDIYKTGSGKIKIRGKIEFEPADKRGEKDKLVITEIPYTMIGSGINKFLIDVAELVKSKKLPEIADIMNQSSSDGIRLVLELKSGADIERIKNVLYKKTKLEDTFGVNMLYVCDGCPKIMNLTDIYGRFLSFQTEVKTKKYKALYAESKRQKEIQEGFIKAVDVIDLIIEIIRGSKTTKMVKDCLTGKTTAGIAFKSKKSEVQAAKLSFTELQAQSILEMKLNKLIGLEVAALLKENEKTVKEMEKYEKILKSKKEMFKLIKTESDEIIKEFAQKRKTTITDAETVDVDLDIVEEKDVAVALNKFNYIKMLDLSNYEKNRETIEAENERVIICKNIDALCVFTDNGNMHQIKCENIPLLKVKDKGVPIDNISNFKSSNENIIAVIPKSILLKTELLFVTRKGFVKLVEGAEFDSERKMIAASKLGSGDNLAFIFSPPFHHLVLRTEDNFFIRFAVECVPKMKKTSVGVRGIKLKDADVVAEAYSVGKKEGNEVRVGEKNVSLLKIKLTDRGGVGKKIKF